MEKAAKMKQPEEVYEAWLEAWIANALPLHLFSETRIRKAILLTAQCGTKLSFI
jgi:hypothetical protein